MVLSAFTHLWNPIGFPSIYIDEGIYMGRAMHVLEGYGPQESNSIFSVKYDHPYFGQLFLAGALSIIGYPDLLNFSPTHLHVDYDYLLRSIEILWLVPRVLMGLLAVVDTFLIYKIAQRRYNNRTIAFIAAILFAVMPMTWLLRWILLDSILLPFLLSSILIAVYCLKNPSSSPLSSSPNYNNNKNKNNKCIPMVLLSGIFLGLSIFTKIPAFTMIPLVGFLVYTNNNRDLKILGLWFIPVILIPLAWPAYAISIGQFDDWLDGVIWQATERIERPLFDALSSIFFHVDAVLLILGMGGFIYAAIKKDYFLLLWFIPFLIFLAILGHVRSWYLIPLIPAFCIAAARLIGGDLSNLIKRKKVQLLLPFAIISAIGIFGLISTTIIITKYNASSQLEKTASDVQYLLQANNSNNNNNGTNSTKLTEEIILDPNSWIFKYIFDLKYYASNHNDDFAIQIKQ